MDVTDKNRALVRTRRGPARITPGPRSWRPSRSRRRRRGLAGCAAANAAAAWFGMAGLIGGWLTLGDTVTERLPFSSPDVAGLALGAFVAVPSSVLATLAWRGDRRTGPMAIRVGAMLIGWIVVQLLVIRTFSWFQPVCVAVGAGFVLAGASRRRGEP